ncbi:M50 family metallopeptidase [Microbacterium album]|uniref:Peptidase n=1 Tax=Microbacterium album TaxID=2053191 RepID=A0A917IG68_9MICO|nr:M50 family metallopeptidase [Microbacterium album]GGH46710.1 peptidase [Microbacterium album]
MTVLAFVIGVLVVVVGLAVSIALHEIGHLAPAKLFRVRVGQYMVGFGPTLWSRRIGETEYGIKALPLGGFISMSGMYPRARDDGRAGGGLFATLVQDARDANAETLEGVDDSRTFYRLPVWKRIVVMLGGPFMNLLLAIVLFAVLYSGLGMPQHTTTVASVSECVLPADAAATECGPGDPPSPASAAGLQPGDELVSLAGRPVSTFAEASAIIREHPGQRIPVVVERDGSERTLQLTPVLAQNEYVDAAGRTVVDEVGFAGLSPAAERVAQPLWAGPQAAFENVGLVTGIVAQLPARLWDTAVDLFTGQERDPDGPLSVIGVGRLAGEVAATEAPIVDRVAVMIGLLGAVNIALFVFNLIPLLPLDGGHVAIALWDGIRRAWAKLFRRPPPAPTDATRLVPVTLLVVALLIGMAALLFAADIFNPIRLVGG